MSIEEQLSGIVSHLVTEVEKKVSEQAASSINEQLKTFVENYDVETAIKNVSTDALEKRIANYPIDVSQIRNRLEQEANQNLETFKQNLVQTAKEAIAAEIAKLQIKNQVEQTVKDYVSLAAFPPKSIRAKAINFDNYQISGDNVQGGIITKFASTGIDDRASRCQVTILDNMLVSEQPVLTTGLDVRGDAKIDGNIAVGSLAITSDVDFDSVGVKRFVEGTFDRVKESFASTEVETPQITKNGHLIISTREIGPSVLKSALRRVGTLEELQTSGRTLLSDTVYVSGKRVGINTLEPAATLHVWDEEAELAFGKISKQRGYLGSKRNTALTLGANGKDNISLEPDGSVTINDLRLGALPLSTASDTPNWSGRSGEIVFNDSPAVGRPIGWVCLGGTRWGSFGKIE